MSNNPLLLFTNNDIPFPSAKMVIHNPSITELSLIGENTFRVALYLILHLAQDLKSQGNSNLEDKEDFDIFIEAISKRNMQSSEYKNHFLSLLALIFPNYKMRIRTNDIQFIPVKATDNSETYFIDKTNFQEFQQIISDMFVLESNDFSGGYNPSDLRASKIAEKLKKMKKKNNSEKNANISVYKRYASILSVGMHMDVNIFLNYTVRQIETQFKRYTLWAKWDATFKMKLAGASGLDEVEDWMQEV